MKHSEGLLATGGRFLFPKGALTHHLSAGQAVVLLLRISHALCEADAASAEAL